MATIEQITTALARTEDRLVERIESAFRDLSVHLHGRFDALEERLDRFGQGSSDLERRDQDIEGGPPTE